MAHKTYKFLISVCRAERGRYGVHCIVHCSIINETFFTGTLTDALNELDNVYNSLAANNDFKNGYGFCVSLINYSPRKPRGFDKAKTSKIWLSV
jgi:hypothetical protein